MSALEKRPETFGNALTAVLEIAESDYEKGWVNKKETEVTPSPPTKSSPTKSPLVKLSGRPPIKLYGHENSHPLELRVCLSQIL